MTDKFHEKLKRTMQTIQHGDMNIDKPKYTCSSLSNDRYIIFREHIVCLNIVFGLSLFKSRPKSDEEFH